MLIYMLAKDQPMNTVKEKTPQIIVVGSGPPKRPAAKIVASPSKMPKWISVSPPTVKPILR